MVAYGLLVVVAAPPIASKLTGRRRQRLALQIGGLAVIITGLVPKDLPQAPHTLQSLVHVGAAITAGTALTAAIAISAAHARANGSTARRSAATAAITVLAAAVFPFAWGGPVYGAIERLILVGPLLWLTYAGGGVAADGRRPSIHAWVNSEDSRAVSVWSSRWVATQTPSRQTVTSSCCASPSHRTRSSEPRSSRNTSAVGTTSSAAITPMVPPPGTA